MAREFGAALRDAGAPVEVRRVPGCDHNVICFRLRRPGDPTAAALFEFLEKHGGGGAGSVPRRPPSGD
jgi:acetyl esterase/lipase